MNYLWLLKHSKQQRYKPNSEKLPEYQGTPCSKPTQYLKIKELEQDLNPQPFSKSGKMTILCCEYLSLWCIDYVF